MRVRPPQAREFIASGEVDVTGTNTVFGQAARILGSMHPRSLRRSGQLYKVNDISPVNFGYGAPPACFCCCCNGRCI